MYTHESIFKYDYYYTIVPGVAAWSKAAPLVPPWAGHGATRSTYVMRCDAIENRN